MSDLIGKEIGTYRVVSRIRTGGMGEVYLAEHQTLGKKVAVKTLPPKLAEDKEFVSRFREAQLMAGLTHPHLVQVHDAGELEGVYYFVMDYVAGPDDAPCDLHVHRHAQPAGRLPEKRVRDWAIQIAEALAYIHERGVIHRDLKPANILIDAHDNAKLTDFGLAKVIGSEFIQTHVAERIQHTLDSVPTETGGDLVRPADTLDDAKTRLSGGDSRSSTASGVRGTPDYMAPEQRVIGGEIDQRTDIYAFGVTVFHLLTGQLPGRRTDPALVVPGLMKGWGAILKRCLAPDASDRYESAAALLEDLRALRPRPRWPVLVGSGVAVVVVGVAIWAIPQIIVGGSGQITTQPVDGNDQSQLAEQVPVDFTRVDQLQQRARALQENGEPIEALGVYAEALEAVDGLLESHPENELVAERRKEVDEEKSAVLREARELASEQKQAGDEFVEAARKARRAETYVENTPKALAEYDAASRMVGQILEHAPGDEQTQRLGSAISEAQLEAFRETRRFARDHSGSGVRRIADIRDARTADDCTRTIDTALRACQQALRVADMLQQAGDERGYSEKLRADLSQDRRTLLDGLCSHADRLLGDIERALDDEDNEEALLLCALAEAIGGRIPEKEVDFDKTAFLNKVVTLRGAVLNASEKEEQYKTLYLEAQKASLEHDYDECVKYAERAQNVKRTREVDDLIQKCTYEKNLAEGQALEEKCDLENAVRAYERASQALPHYPEGRDALHRAQGKWDSQQKAENLIREAKNLEQPPTLENLQKALTKYEDGLSYARCPDTTQEIQDRVESVKARIRQVQLREKTSLTVDVDVDLSDWYHNTGVKSLKVWVDERVVKDVKNGKVAIDPWSENVSPGSYTIRIQTTCWYQRRVAGRGGRSATGFHPAQHVPGEASRTVTVALGEAKTVEIKVKGKTKGKWSLDVTISD